MCSITSSEMAETFADCETVTTFEEHHRKTHVPDYRTCDRLRRQIARFHQYSCAHLVRHAHSQSRGTSVMTALQSGANTYATEQLDTTFDLKTGTADRRVLRAGLVTSPSGATRVNIGGGPRRDTRERRRSRGGDIDRRRCHTWRLRL